MTTEVAEDTITEKVKNAIIEVRDGETPRDWHGKSREDLGIDSLGEWRVLLDIEKIFGVEINTKKFRSYIDNHQGGYLPNVVGYLKNELGVS